MLRRDRIGCCVVGAALALVSPAVFAADIWPAFRGDGSSLTSASALPSTWEKDSAKPGNWTVNLPGYGQSSPVVWKDRIFVTAVTGAEKENTHVLAISLADGKTLWQKDFVATQRVKDSENVSRGAPTPVIEEDRLYAVFESGDVIALTHAGDVVWQRSFVKDYGEIKGNHGYASSPLIIDDKIILQVAHSGPSYVLALNKATGENVWKSDLPNQNGWASPALYKQGDTTGIVISASGSVRALSAKDGQPLWVVNEVQGNTTASPTIVGETVYIGAAGERGGGGGGRPGAADGKAKEGSEGKEAPKAPPPPPAPGSPGSLAIKLGGSGDVTETHVAWKSAKVSSAYCSPLVVDGLGFYVNRAGVAQCVDIATGDVKWTKRLAAPCWVSPIASEGRVFFFCKNGSVVAMKASGEMQELSESQIASPEEVYGVAAIDGSWIIRTGRSLIRVSN